MILDGNSPVIANSLSVARIKGLAELLDRPVICRGPMRDVSAGTAVLAWGRKPSALRAKHFADRLGLPLINLEDGFLRSVGFGSESPPLSIVMDDLGIYYDARTPSRLESLVGLHHSEVQLSRARALINAWRMAKVSKYNHAREYAAGLPERYVLVADQTSGDASIHHGLADEASFQRMLAAALAENPGCMVLLKIHPEVMAGRKHGHFDLAALAGNPRVQVLGTDAHPASIIEHAEAIYTVSSQIGFEGLVWGKRVHTFGMPFYAGWGLTRDELPAPDRRKTVPLENLVHAALVEYPRYADPETGKRCEVERVIEWMGLQRKMRERFPAIVYATGFSLYKRPIVRNFFQGSRVRFVRHPGKVPADVTLAIWGRRVVASGQDHDRMNGPALATPSRLEHKNIHVVRLEDGFIRSIGLGADLVRPLSWVMDNQGIYYDASRPSELEDLLQTNVFDGALIARAQALRERMVAEGLTKYNVSGVKWQRPQNDIRTSRIKRQLILVPGQVESDASLAYGTAGICRNIELLRAVRTANPEAYVIYKPHPDVEAGLRRQGQGEDEVSRWCDEVVRDAAMGELLPQVDEVHTLTSLAGFEALLRGKKVVCYGLPFYAGWGLTGDVLTSARRTRQLSLDELVAGALILYPVYISRSTDRFTTPERTLDELLAWRQAGSADLPWWYHTYRNLTRRVLRQP